MCRNDPVRIFLGIYFFSNGIMLLCYMHIHLCLYVAPATYVSMETQMWVFLFVFLQGLSDNCQSAGF